MSFLSGLFSRKRDSEISLIVDIGSESIGAVFVRTNKNKQPEVLGTTRHVIPFQEKINMERFVLLLQETLTGVINDPEIKKGALKPKNVIFTLASPWYKSQTRVVHIEEEEEFVITESGLNTILEKEEKIFIDNGEVASQGVKNKNESSIESYITQIKVGGYEVENPIGRKTKNIDISIHVASSPISITSALSNIIGSNWPGARVIFHTFMFSAFNAVRDKFHESQSYILIDIAGEITDISLIRENVIIESISFPLGYRSFLRATMRQLTLQSDLAASEIELYLKKELSPERANIIEAVFIKTLHDWSLLFTASIKQLSLKYPVSRNIFLLTNDGYIEHFEKVIKSSSIDIFGENQEDFKVFSLDSQNLASEIINSNNCKDLFLCVTIIMLVKLLSIENKHNKN